MATTRTVYHHLLPTAAKALANGGTMVSPARVKWDASGRCQRPVTVVREGRPFRHQRQGRILVLDMETRCRRCPACLAQRAREWTARAIHEVAGSSRTWFGTLTLGPQVQMANAMRARIRHPDFSSVSEERRFGYLVQAAGPLITKWLKRVRKETGSRIRYVVVAERHKSGLPHFHILVHECDMATPVRKAVLERQWFHGFSRWKLADKWSARYVCKYLAKEAASRVRASFRYGSAAWYKAVSNDGRPHDIGTTGHVGFRGD